VRRNNFASESVAAGSIFDGFDQEPGLNPNMSSRGLSPGPNAPRREQMSYFVYILASRKHGTLYIGVTNGLARRVWEHREGIGSKFTKKYRIHRLVYAEPYDEIERAIQREKTMKEWPRVWKIRTIERDNPERDDLYDKLNG
jgi:putative endonuclease